ncbi:glycosyltransferase family 2 protein [Rubinisphaera margarita]|uniref:glycosyltransferase family 2 protein n=1 Tax=Rubinisphaera margarita TaxID=2909586 RepID=UPI001EE78502|nr:galactosyltransferase-related protein [Rubinisphaera margarita]MCG6158195.1 galactosyltransferase-related protein [Rubinisphaera margarita]
MIDASVLTIVKGRRPHLENQLRGLEQSIVSPKEWVIVGMDEDPPQLESAHFPIRLGRVNSSGQGEIPLAQARNRAASLASSPLLVFLDVDCIPSPGLMETFGRVIADSPQLWMGTIGYLPPDAASRDWTFDDLAGKAIEHPLLPKLDGADCLSSDRYELFWSLNFAIPAELFSRIGGFDENYAGYGAEDTDFAFMAREQGIPFGFAAARAYHQHHAVCKPPLNHFRSILINAERFRQKWGLWPMEKWLRQFDELGLIDFNANSNELAILKDPTESQIREATVNTPAGF